MTNRKNQRGVAYTTDQILSVAGTIVLLGIIAGIYGFFNAKWDNGDSKRLLSDLISTVKETYSVSGNGTMGDGTTDQNLIPALLTRKLLDPAYVVGSGTSATMRHPWEGPITITGSPSGDTHRAAISFGGLDLEHCIEMGTYTASNNNKFPTVKVITINGTALSFPATETAISTACADNSTNVIAWEFY